MRPSEWPLRYKIEAVVLYVAIMGAVAWLWSKVIYDWSPKWLIDVMFAGMVIAIAGYYVVNWLSRWQELRRNRLTGGIREPGGIVTGPASRAGIERDISSGTD